MHQEKNEGLNTENEETILPGLSIIHSNLLEDLRRVAVEWVGSHPLKPLETELFIVQSNGMAQWLKLALASNDGCGISAALDIQLPGRFVWNAYRAVLGGSAIPDQSPYDKNQLVWRLLRLLPSLLEDGRFAPLKSFLEGDRDMRKGYQLACHLADLFDQYQVYRADWLELWAAGEDRLIRGNGAGMDMPENQLWQPELWRRIRGDLSGDLRGNSRADLHRRFLDACGKLKFRPREMPRRVIVFGISSLPAQVLEVLHAVSSFSQVLLFVHNPCRHYWADIIEDRELLRIESFRHKRKTGMPENLDPDLLHNHVNPLLAAWGRQGRDYIGLLYGYDRPGEYRESFAEIDLFEDVVLRDGKSTLLQEVQQAILDLTPLPPSSEERGDVASGDDSISFHLAHSRQREVEILQDRLLSFFEDDPGLHPRDIIVMTPDIEAYAPHIEAVFGNVRAVDDRFIPFTIGDRPGSGSRPLISALSMLLHLPDSRLTVGEVMDLLEISVVRDRFGVEEDHLPRLLQWIQGSAICWGLSGEHRRGFDLPRDLEQNTWNFGLSRMLLGYAVGDGGIWQDIVPYDEVGGLEAALVGPLAALVDRLEAHGKSLAGPADPEEWCSRIRALISDFFTASTPGERLTLSRADDVLDQWLQACRDAGLEEPLTLAVVRESFLGAMTGSSISQRFLAGMVNFCTLMPMRAIPFKVVCLMGMNDGEYPRSHPPLDFDLMAGPGIYRPGDRSRREDDRYLFLEALLSARKKFYISHVGRNVRDNTQRMPSVLVGQFRDYLAAGWKQEGVAGDESLPELLTCSHPLQPFSRLYFRPGSDPALFTYAREWQELHNVEKETSGKGAQEAWGAQEGQKDSWESVTLDPPQFDASLQLASLIRFLKNPVESFFNQRLKVYFDEIQPPTRDQEPFALDILAPFGMGAELLSQGLQASEEEGVQEVLQAARRLRLTGELPLGGIGELAAWDLSKPVLAMMDIHRELLGIWPHGTRAREINLPVELEGCGCRALEDWLDGLQTAVPDDGVPPSPGASRKISPGEIRQSPPDPGDTCLKGADPALARWEFYHRPVLNSRGSVEKFYPFTGLWVRHLAGCAMGIPLTSFLVTPDGRAGFAPLKGSTALGYLNEIISCWWLGLMGPLPVSARSAFEYLNNLLPRGSDQPDPALEEKALGKARKAYEGDGFHSQGELGFSPYLRRVYPEFNDLLTPREPRDFRSLAAGLYLPMVLALRES